MPATVTLHTDDGLQDEYVGVCHGVPRHAIPRGALALRRALAFDLPAGERVEVRIA